MVHDIIKGLEGQSIIIYDLETDSTKTDKANFKCAGYYSYKTGETAVTTDIKTLIHQLKNHRYIVTFNGLKYDNVIMERYGMSFRNKINIDLYNILSDRGSPFNGKGRGKLINNSFNSFSLDACLKTIGIKQKKMTDFDYSILKKSHWTQEELDYIIKYTKNDIIITRKLYEFLEDFFYSIGEYMTDRQIDRKQYLTASTGAIAYKAICKLANLEEHYSDDDGAISSYEGGYVALPTKDYDEGDIYCLDFTSLYPHMFMLANLFTPVEKCMHKVGDKCPNPYTGDGFFKLVGTYCGCKLGIIENVILNLFTERKVYKKAGDRRQQRNKIIINSMYGISASSNFVSIYYPHTASDCTLMGRTCTKYARKIFMEHGYDVLYSDTDSIYLKDVFKDRERMMKIKDTVVSDTLARTPFPLKSFDLDIDFEITNIWFFENPLELGKYKKKHYSFIYKDYPKGSKVWRPKLKLKGLPIIKRNATRLSIYIYEKYLLPEILVKRDIKFPRDLIMRYIEFEINRDYTQLGVIFNVNDLDDYKNPNQLQAQIGRYTPIGHKSPLGVGKHAMIKNSIVGVGMSTIKYCTIEEAKGLRFHHFVIAQVLNELMPFTLQPKQMRISNWFGESDG